MQQAQPTIFLRVNKSFSPFLALRYLKPKRSFVSIITLISVVGVALGVTVLVVVIAVFTGFGIRLKESILASQPHLMVDLQSPRTAFGADGGIIESPFAEWPNAVERIQEIDGITSVTPLVNGPVLLRHNGFQKAPFIQAIEPQEGPSLERYRNQTEGEFDLVGQNAVLGDDLAFMFGIEVGDRITLTSPDLEAIGEAVERMNKAQTQEEKASIFDEVSDLTLPTDLDVVGLFNSGNQQFDINTIFVPLEIGQEMFDLGPYAHALAIDTDRPFEMEEVEALKQQIIQSLEGYYPVSSWMDNNSALLSAVATERNMMFFLLFIIMIVAGFCIMNTMITVVYQKRAEIGLLKALGASESHIVKLFLLQGIIVGILGVALGQIWARLLIFYRNDILEFASEKLKVNVFDPNVYGIEGGLPAVAAPSDSLTISLFAFIACALASLIPAWMAARLQPAEALRSE
jgi:lipoprotein-releasing system permease protein